MCVVASRQPLRSRQGELRLVETCLKLGAKVNYPSPHNGGMTALHYTVHIGSESMVKCLLDAGADTRIETTDGLRSNPICYYMTTRNVAIADLILRHEEEEVEASGETLLKPIPPHLEGNYRIARQLVAEFRQTGTSKSAATIRVADVSSRMSPSSIEHQKQAIERHGRLGARQRQQCDYCDQYAADLKQCSACAAVAYCGRECQRKHWKTHRATCKQVQTENATKAAPTEGDEDRMPATLS